MEQQSPSTAGTSAQREYESRRAKDEAAIRAQWGRLGGLAVALSSERQSTAAWATGAKGERALGARLDGIASDEIRVLHDRRLPKGRANIDHIVVTRAGVFVIDAKRYKGRPERVVEGGIVRPRVEKLVVGRRDQSKLVDGVLGQIEKVAATVGDVPVAGVLCFVDADWPMFGGDFTIRGVAVCWPKLLTKRLLAATGTVDVGATTDAIAAHFVPA